MEDESLPNVVAEHHLTVNGVELRCAVLDNGLRVVNVDDANRLFKVWMTGVPCDDAGVERLALWCKGRMEH